MTLKDGSRKTSKDVPLHKIPEEETPQADCKRKILKVVVTALFILIVVGVVVIWSLHEGRSRKHIGNHYFDFIAKNKVLNVHNDRDKIVLAGNLKTSAFDVEKVRKCDSDEGLYCFTFEDGTRFQFIPYKLPDSEVNCVDLVWDQVTNLRQVPIDCYDVEYGLWYGLPNFQGHFWPLDLDNLDIKRMPYRPYYDKVLGQVLENYWLSTEGIAIIAHQNLPLKVSYNSGNDRKLCLALDAGSLVSPTIPRFNYSVCQGSSIKQTFMATRNAFFPKTYVIDYVSHDFSKIIWNFEKQYFSNPDNFGEFLLKLDKADLPMNMIQFDSTWEEHWGDFKFEPLRMNEISQNLIGKFSKTKLMLPITLACSYMSHNFMTGVEDRLFVKDPLTNAFQTIRYRDQSCALWDATNPETRSLLQNLFNLLFKDGDIPQAFEFQTTVGSKAFPLLLSANSTDVNKMNLAFLEVLLKVKKLVLMETAFRFQQMPVFVEVPTTVANKSGKRCLDYMISGALTAGIHGYPYLVLTQPQEELDQELFTRWLEVAMLLPGLKITNSAVNFGSATANLTKKLSSYREEFVMGFYDRAVKDISKGYPLVRPMWWINPKDYKTLQISDQFLIGTDLMVAPVLCHGDRKRDIYLPEGEWVHSKTMKTYTGGQWLKEFAVPLEDIPVFHALEEVESTTVDNNVTSSEAIRR